MYFLPSFVKPKNGQIVGVFVFFEQSRSKKLRFKKKKTCFLTPRKPKTTVVAVFFCSWNQKPRCLQCFGPEPTKNGGIYAVFSMLQDVLLPGQTHKNSVNYSVSAFETRWKPPRTTNKVKPKNCQIGGVFVFFEHSRSKKLRKNRVFLTPRKPKTTVFAVFFCSWNQKPRYLQCFMARTWQRQWYLRSFQHVARRTFARPNAQKHRKLQCFGIWNPMKTVENHQQVSKMEHLVRAQKTRQTAGRFLSSPQPGSGLTFQKRTDFGPPPPHTP